MDEEDEIYLNYLTSAPDEDEELCDQMNDFLDHGIMPLRMRILTHLEQCYDKLEKLFEEELLTFYRQQKEDEDLSNVVIDGKKELTKEQLAEALSRLDLMSIFINVMTGEFLDVGHMKYKQYFIIELHYRNEKQRFVVNDCRLK